MNRPIDNIAEQSRKTNCFDGVSMSLELFLFCFLVLVLFCVKINNAT